MAAWLAGPVVVALVSCFDGDTCRMDATVWLEVALHTQVRIRGIDTPEIYGQCDAERMLAKTARDFLVAKLQQTTKISIFNIEHDKYGGRVVADVHADGESVARMMIEAGLARAY